MNLRQKKENLSPIFLFRVTRLKARQAPGTVFPRALDGENLVMKILDHLSRKTSSLYK